MAFNDLVKKVAAQEGAQAIKKNFGGLKYFAHNFTPQNEKQFGGVSVPVYNLTAAQFATGLSAGNNDWCDGDEIGGVNVNLTYHDKAGISLPDTGIQLTAGGYAGCAYGEATPTVTQILRDATVGIINALEKRVEANIYSMFTEANVARTALTGFTASPTGVGAALAEAAAPALSTESDLAFNPKDATLILDPASYFALIPQIAYSVYGGTDPVQDGVLEKYLGLKAVICATLPTGIKGALVADGAFGVVNRVNQPAINGYFDTFTVTTEDGFSVGFRAFEHLCQGALKFGGDILYGAEFIHQDSNGKAQGVLLLK